MQTVFNRWLVFGGSGAVGRFALRALAETGAQVTAVSRQPPAWSLPGLRWLRASLEHGPTPATLLEPGTHFDVLCSLGPLDAFATWLAAHPPAEGQRVLALSSLSADWKQRSPNPAERALARALAENEQRVLAIGAAHAAPTTVLRCGLIHGAGVDRSLTPLLRLARRWPLPWPRGARGLRQPVHARDLARAVLAAAVRPSLAQSTLSLPGPEALSFPCMLQRSLNAEGREGRLIALPLPGLRGLLDRLARGHGVWADRAAKLRRLYDDQLGPQDDWGLLGIPADSLRRLGEPGSSDFQY